MWLTDQKTNAVRTDTGGAMAVAQVTNAEGGAISAANNVEYRSLPVFAPLGLSYIPAEGEKLLIVALDNTAVCAGVLSDSGGLSPGEIRIKSQSGAEIALKNNGDIILNGVIITIDGKIVSK